EVDAGLTVLRAGIGAREALEQLLEQVAVAGGELGEGRLFDALAGRLVALEPFARAAARRELGEVEQIFCLAVVFEHLEHPRRLGALLLIALFVDEAARRLA